MNAKNEAPTVPPGLAPDGSVVVPVEPPPPADPPAGAPPAVPMVPEAELERRVREAVEAARKQEKDKLYGRLEKTAEEVKALQAQAEAEAKARADAEKQAAAAAKAAEEAEMSAKELLERRQAEWAEQQRQRDEEFNAFRAEVEAREAQRAVLEEKEREYAELMAYRQAAIDANKQNIEPNLIQWIGGNTREEIDAAVARAIDTTAAIVNNVQAAQAAYGQTVPGRGPSTTAPPMGPMEQQSGQKTWTPEEINAMSPQEYAANRHLLLGAIKQGHRSY